MTEIKCSKMQKMVIMTMKPLTYQSEIWYTKYVRQVFGPAVFYC